MSSLPHSAAAVTIPPPPASGSSFRPLFSPPGVWFYGPTKDNKLQSDHIRMQMQCNVISSTSSKPPSREYEADVFKQNGLPALEGPDLIVQEHHIDQGKNLKVSTSKEINRRVNKIKSMLNSMEDGKINVSPYDTAWVALVQDVNGSSTGRISPQFPGSLDWIANNQLTDGSWGDALIFQAHDRILNTLACVIALASWNLHRDKCEKGMKFFKENLCKLEDESMEHMPIGFEVTFPSLLELARRLNLDVVPHDSHFLQHICAARNIKLKEIPMEVLHMIPTTLLYSLEGMEGLVWEKLLNLQNEDGSFLFSPASTAYALSQTKDQKSLGYLTNIVHKFKGGVPNVYPVDLFEHIWAIDRIQRLGISRYFQPEINKCIDYIEKYWDEKGICWGRNSRVNDIDDTAMGFRILRMHGRHVSPGVFKQFEKDGEFCCFVGQSNKAVTGLFNLFRASQMLFPGEEILEKAKQYGYKFLREKQATNELLDKWIITKDLPGEVGYALDIPFYASLPRLESRFFIQHYGGDQDVWIGKTLYRMFLVNNDEYLELAKNDYNSCQAIHRMEWDKLQKWYMECGVGNFGVSKRSLLQRYYVAAATVFEGERSEERLAWAKTTALLDAIQSYFHVINSKDQRAVFVHEFSHGISSRGHVINRLRSSDEKARQALVKLVLSTLNHISFDCMVAHGRDVAHSLRHSWEEWLVKWEEEGDRGIGEAELVVNTLSLTSATGHRSLEEILAGNDEPEYQKLADIANRVCHQLAHFRHTKEGDNNNMLKTTTPEIERGMQELVRMATQKPTSDQGTISNHTRHSFLDVAKTFYYVAVCDSDAIDHHIAKVLFEEVC